jgi:hypothetical protein
MTTLDVALPLVPASVLPVQIEPVRARAARGERALMLAVLEDAIRCLQEHWRAPRAQPRRLAREAEAWIRSGTERPFSFLAICDALDIPAPDLRAALLARREVPCAAGRAYRLNLRAARRRLGAVG